MSLPTKSEAIAAVQMDKSSPEFGEFLNRCQPYIVQICKARGVQDNDAENIAQTIFTKLIRNYTYTGESEFNSWMHRIVINSITDLYKSVRRRPRMPNNMLEQSDKADPPLDKLIRDETWQRILAAASEYDPIAATLLHKQHVEHKPTQTAALEVGVHQHTAETKIHRLRIKLRNRFRPDPESHNR